MACTDFNLDDEESEHDEETNTGEINKVFNYFSEEEKKLLFFTY